MTHHLPASAEVVILPSGAPMPLLAFGTWQLEGQRARSAISCALAAGYRHIDTATRYQNELDVGVALSENSVSRQNVFVTTKVPPDHVGRQRQTLSESLAALGVDYLDLWLIHWPPEGDGLLTSWQSLIAARDDGLVRDIGVSNYSLDQIDRLSEVTGVMPAVNQIEWSPFLYDRAVLAGHRERQVVVAGWSPFRSSKLDDPVLVGVSQNCGKSPTQVIVRWHLQHQVVVIPKSGQPDRIRQNRDVFDFELDAEAMAKLDGLGPKLAGPTE